MTCQPCECGHPWADHYDGWCCLSCADEEGKHCPTTVRELARADALTDEERVKHAPILSGGGRGVTWRCRKGGRCRFQTVQRPLVDGGPNRSVNRCSKCGLELFSGSQQLKDWLAYARGEA